MTPLNYVLAVALLATPPDPARRPDLTGLATVRSTVQSVALSWELMDPLEVRFVLGRDEDFAGDMKLLRRRWADLHDAPPLADAERWPSRPSVNGLLAFNRDYRQHVENQQQLDPVGYWAWHEILVETDQRYAIWDLVRDARTDVYYVSVRRGALKKLREALGPELYYAGVLPHWVPSHRFIEMDR